MRGATQCARRLKQLTRSLRTKLGKVARPATGDPIAQMILGIFSRDVPEAKAHEALDQLRAQVVDYNELRVVPAIEMTEMVGELPGARLKCEDLSRALNKVFLHEHEVSLDRLGELTKKREVVEYLEEVDGLDAYSRARVRLLGLQLHAVPLDEAMWAYARKTTIVDRRCSLEVAQAFLERRIPDGAALEFVALFQKQAWSEMGAAVRDREVRPICSVPPDRTSRNMLQLVASGRSALASVAPPKSPEAVQAAEPAKAAKGIVDEKPAVVAPKKPTTKPAAKPKTPKLATGSKKKTAAKGKVKAKAKAKAKTKAKTRAKRKSKPATQPKSGATKAGRPKAAKRARRSTPKAKSA